MEIPPYPLIKRGLQQGKVIPFLGAGASLGERNPAAEPWNGDHPSGYPLGSELGDYLAELIALDPAPPDLATIAQCFEYQAGRKDLDDELDRCLTADSVVPKLHRYLAQLPGPLIIVTTNYDDLLEQAFTEAGHEFDLIAYGNTSVDRPDSLMFWQHGSSMIEVPANKLVPSFERTVIYKFHGFRKRDATVTSQYVITEDDYIDFLSRMVATKAVPHSLVERFRSHAFLFLGYGLADWNLRLLLNRISRGRAKQTKSWAIQHQIQPFERPIWEARNVNLYELSLSTFLSGLEDAR